MITEKKLKERVLSMAKGLLKTVEEKTDKAIASGCLDLDNADDNFILPKAVLTAILTQESREYSPIKYETGTHRKTRKYREFEKEVNNIISFI